MITGDVSQILRETKFSSPTRSSLLNGLKDWSDETSWRDFFQVYRNLIHGMALKAGLTEPEAQDVVQETLVSVANRIRTFKYERAKGSFRAWLRILTNWRIKDQYRRRMKGVVLEQSNTSGINLADQISAKESIDTLSQACEREWVAWISDTAVKRTKAKVSPRDFQIFQLSFLREWPAKRVASTLKTTCSQVYVSKHRVSVVFRKELAALHRSVSVST